MLPQTKATSGNASAPPSLRNFRLPGRILAGVGVALTCLGGAAVVAGGVLPWARFAVFGIPLAIPGVLAAWGAGTLSCGLLSLTYARRVPVIGVVLGIAATVGGITGRQTVGHTVVRTLLHIENAVAPVNARLAQAALPPIEPFPTIRPAADYGGSGPLWTTWGGAALTLGSACRFAGGRLRRTCAACKKTWDTNRADAVVFCPRCGSQAAQVTDCSALLRGFEARRSFLLAMRGGCRRIIFRNGFGGSQWFLPFLTGSQYLTG